MYIDNLLKGLKEEEASKRLPGNISEKCWQNIKQNIEKKQKWYDRFFLKLHNVNRRYHMKLIFQIAMLLAVVVAAPYLFKGAKSYIQDSAFFNGKVHTASEDNKENNVENQVVDSRPEYVEKDANYLKALETVRTIAKEKYKKFSLYSTGEVIKDSEDKQSYYRISIFENSTGSVMPAVPDVFEVNARTYAVRSADSKKTVEEYFAAKAEDYKYKYELSDMKIILLINKADNLNISNIDALYSSVDLYVNLRGRQKNTNPSIPEDAYYYEKNENIYYTYDKSAQSLYKHNTVTGEKKRIYKYNPNELSSLARHTTADINGDGKDEKIFYDPLTGVLGVNEVCVYVDDNFGWLRDFNIYSIVDIYGSDKQKEIYIRYNLPNDYKVNNFYSYKDGTITMLVSESGEPAIDGNGKLRFKNVVSQFFQTHSVDLNYQYYRDNSLRILKTNLNEAIVSVNGSKSYQEVQVKKEVKIYKDKNNSEVAAVLNVGENVKLIGYDEENWVMMENSKGVRGWLEVEEMTVKELNLFSGDVFEGLFFAG